MAGMKFNADIDLKNIVKLRQEIDKLKKSLIEIASVPNSDAAIKQLESEIDRATKKLSEYKDSYAKLQKIKYDIDSSNSTVKRVKEETSALQSTNKWIIANTESVKEADRQIKQLKKDFSALSDEEKVGDTGTAKIRQIQQLAAQRLVEEEAVRKTIKAQKDQIIQSNAEEGSITALRKQLILLIKDYDDLGRVRRGGDSGKALLTQISNVQKELNAAEQASGRFQRNVGNYASAWNGLGFSVQQVARELPSLAVSANTFFLAISNNIPILVDEIAKARKEYAAFKAELAAGNKDVKAVAPVWQQLTKSLISWQTALVVGLTLLSVYGKDVIKWIGSLGKARDVTLDLLSAEQEMALARKSAWSSIVKEQTQLDILYNKLKNVTLSTTERNAAVREWVKNYKTHSDILDGENVDLRKLENAYRALSKEIYANAVARAYADRIAELSVQREKEETKRLRQKLTIAKAEQELERVTAEYNKKANEGFGTATAKLEAKDKIIQARKNVEDQKKIYNDLVNNVNDYDKNITVISNHIKTLDLFPQPKEGTYDYWKQQVEVADDALKQITSEQKKVLDEASKNSKKDLHGLGIDGAVVDSYKKAVKDKAEAEKQLKVYGDSSKEQKMAEKEADKQKKDQKKLAEDLLSLRRQNQQAEIDLMEEGTEKKLKQIDLDYQKELDAIKKQEKDLSERQGGKLTQEQSVEISTLYTNAENERDKAIADVTKNQLKAEQQAWNEYLIEYGNFQQKKAAINAEYNQKIAEATTKGEKESLKKQQINKLKEVTFDELKKSINFADIFGDLDVQSTETLTKMRDKLKELIDKSAKDLKPTDLKALQEAFSNIDLKIAERNPFGELSKGIYGYKSATEAVIKAQEDLNTVQQGGEVIVGVYTDETGKLVTKLLTQEQAERNLSDAQKKRLESQGKLTKAVNSIGEKGQQLVNAGNNLVDMLTNLGVEVPESISGALSGLGQIMSGLESIDLTKPFSIISATTGILSGFVQTITSFFGGPNGTAYYESVKEQLESINEIYDRIIDKSKEEITFGGGFASIQAASQALDNYYKKVANLQKIADASGRAGASWKSHSAEWHSNKNVGAVGGFEQMSQILGKSVQSMDDLYYLTGDELYLVQSQLPEAWSQIDSRIKENLQSIIDCKDEANELRDALNQAMTGIDFDSFYNGFIDQLSDMDTSFEDMCDNFEGYLRKSIMAGLVASQYKGRINALYEQWSDAAKSGNKITEDEAELLRGQYQQIVEDMMRDREEMFKSFGWDSSSSSSQEASKKGFATASQDSIDELNGRFTALQIAGEEIKSQNQLQTMSILELRADMLPIIANTTGIKDIASETRDLLRLSYEAIVDIRDNTNVIVKPIQQMASDIAEVKRNTSKL